MPRTAISVFSVGLNSVASVTPTAIDQANGMSLNYERDDLSLIVTNSSAENPLTMTLQGVNGADDIAVEVPASGTVAVGNIESFRVKKSDGSVDVDFTTGAAGTVFAVKDAV